MKYSPYPKYKKSGVEWLGDVPEKWEVKKIKYIIKHIKIGPFGSDLTLDMMTDDGIKVYGQENLINNDFSLGDKFISEKKFEEMKIYTVEKNDILISMMGTIGKCRVVPSDFKKGIINSHLIKIKVNQSVVYPHYLALIISDSGYVDFEINRESVGTIMSGLNSSIVKSLSILLPSLPEQQAITDFLDLETQRIDTLIGKKQKLIELLKEKRTALISRAVTKGLNPKAKMKPSGVEWLGDVPEHWEVKRLKYILQEPLQYGANEAAELDDPELPRFVRITDVDESGNLREETFRSLPEEIAKPFLLDEGDLLFARSGATVGKTFFYRKAWGKAAYAGYLIRARLKKSMVYPDYINFITKSSFYSQWISSILIQATIQNVSAEKYASYVIPLPPIQEQQAIADFLDRETAKIDTLIMKVEAVIEKLKEYRTALISAAVTGKIDVLGK